MSKIIKKGERIVETNWCEVKELKENDLKLYGAKVKTKKNGDKFTSIVVKYYGGERFVNLKKVLTDEEIAVFKAEEKIVLENVICKKDTVIKNEDGITVVDNYINYYCEDIKLS